MAKTLNGRDQVVHPGKATFVAANGKTVYVRDKDVVGLPWAFASPAGTRSRTPATGDVQHLPERAPRIHRVHGSRPADTKVGTGSASTHTGGDALRRERPACTPTRPRCIKMGRLTTTVSLKGSVT